jgi:hypothetical protein
VQHFPADVDNQPGRGAPNGPLGEGGRQEDTPDRPQLSPAAGRYMHSPSDFQPAFICPKTIGPMQSISKFIKTNGLSIVLFSLFVVFLVGQSVAGFLFYNEQQASHGAAQIGYWQFLGSGTFLNGIFSNWQAAILQLASLIIFGVFLVQRGATHSRKHREPGPKDRSTIGSARNWMYRNSLSLAFLALFAISFALHVLTGAAAYNEQRALSGQPALSSLDFFFSAKFWFSTLQTWEAEYFAIGVYMILSIFLRQEGSPESKPVESSNEETGEGNK